MLPASDEPKQTPAAEESSALEIAKSEWTTIELGTPTAIAKAQLTSADASKSIVRKPQRHAKPPEELIPPERPLELSIEPPMAPVPSPPTAAVASPAIPQVQSASRKFKIHYNLAQAVPADQLHVELWVTVDKGATWNFGAWTATRRALHGLKWIMKVNTAFVSFAFTRKPTSSIDLRRETTGLERHCERAANQT